MDRQSFGGKRVSLIAVVYKVLGSPVTAYISNKNRFMPMLYVISKKLFSAEIEFRLSGSNFVGSDRFTLYRVDCMYETCIALYPI